MREWLTSKHIVPEKNIKEKVVKTEEILSREISLVWKNTLLNWLGSVSIGTKTKVNVLISVDSQFDIWNVSVSTKIRLKFLKEKQFFWELDAILLEKSCLKNDQIRFKFLEDVYTTLILIPCNNSYPYNSLTNVSQGI